MSEHKHRKDESVSNAEDKRRSDPADLELVVEGKKVKTTSVLLSSNSSVFAALIANARATREAEKRDAEFVNCRTRRELAERLKLEIPSLKYKDVKMMIECLQASVLVKEEITGVKALRILPLVDQFQMSRLKKACGKALYDSLLAMQKDLGTGRLPVRDVLQYLAAADMYNFDKVRRLCVTSLAVDVSASNRKQIMNDKHISEKTKVKILDRMCDKMDKDYEEKLKQIRLDVDERCREIEQRRDEFMEQLETWKTELRQEVDDIEKNSKDFHTQLLQDLQKKKIIDKIDETMKETTDRLFEEMKLLKDQINFVFESMETKEIIDDMEATRLRETLEEAQENNQSNVERIASRFKERIAENLRVCSAHEITEGFSSGYTLEENVSETFEQLKESIQTMTVDRIRYEEERLAHERTKAQLMKLKIKEHEINTWIKWAKPAMEDEDRCMCFRHAEARK